MRISLLHKGWNDGTKNIYDVSLGKQFPYFWSTYLKHSLKDSYYKKLIWELGWDSKKLLQNFLRSFLCLGALSWE